MRQAAEHDGERGSALLEVIIGMALIAVVILGSTTAMIQAYSAQRAAVNIGLATQSAKSQIETAKSLPWSTVGMKSGGGYSPANAIQTLPTGVAPVIGGEVLPTQTLTIRGVDLDVTTAVGWAKRPTKASQYGAKTVVVTVRYRDRPGEPERVRTERSTIVPQVSDVPPPGVRAE
ncbi:MAG: hypothetical protein L0G99_14905 [Propionibacteriales bacterium]|nr:hypothetical protein [Propionibacteriales bacterium]